MAARTMPSKRTFTVIFQQLRQYSAPADRSIPAAKQKYIPSDGTYPKGFLAGTAHAGVKPSNTRYDDIALVVSEQPCAAAAVFTRNIFKAAPVQTSRDNLRTRRNQDIRGVVVNSGCANAVTGKVGIEHAEIMARETDKCFGTTSGAHAPQTLVMSTGVIGQRLPIDRITSAIPKAHQALGASHEHWFNAAQAICTTDTFPKLISRTFTLPSHPDTEYRIAGMTKGAGMIHPNMATLLGIICTDAKIAADSMRPLLGYATKASFNSISIDGDTSTNDTVALLANGAAAPPEAPTLHVSTTKDESDLPTQRYDDDALAFRTVLTAFMTDLAKLVVRDGEGATKFVTIRVISDVGYVTAKRAAVSIARSALVKTALYGKDANWGRILCAIGYAPGIIASAELKPKDLYHDNPKVKTQVVPARTSVSFVPADGSAELKLLVQGEPEQVDEGRAKEILEMEDLEILVRLEDDGDSSQDISKENQQRYEAVFWTCDFSHEYVTINGDYRT